MDDRFISVPREAITVAERAMEHHLLNGNDTLRAEAAVKAAAPFLMAEGVRVFAAYLDAHPFPAPLPSRVYAQLARERAERLETDDDQEDDDCFASVELAAIDLTVRLAEQLGRVVGDGPTRAHDVNELLVHVHAIQHALMAQATARLYPERFRLLGGVIEGA